MAFVLKDVIKELKESCSLDPHKKLKKANLAKIAAHFRKIPASGSKRSHILHLIEEYCIDNDIIDEVEENPTA